MIVNLGVIAWIVSVSQRQKKRPFVSKRLSLYYTRRIEKDFLNVTFVSKHQYAFCIK